MSYVFHRHTRVTPPVAVRGDGCYIVDADGGRYLDASGGAAVSCLGHSHPAVVDAIRDQVGRLPYAHTAFFGNGPMEALAEHLVTRFPGPVGRRPGKVYFVSGGSEAVEAAIKMARQYFVEVGQPQRRHVIARRQSYHGNTLGALAIGGNEWRRAPYKPILIPATHVSPCYAYRGLAPGESEAAYGERVADELEGAIAGLGTDTVMAFIAEPVVGATAGGVPAVPGYFRRIRDICDRHGVLLILDEVMCGMGRTGTLYACEQDGVAPDLMSVAKGLGAGYQPIGAVLVTDRIHDAFRDGSGYFQHGHTYMGHPTACAAGLAVQQTIERDGLLAQVQHRGATLRQALADRFGDHPHIGDIRGRGLMIGVELVADRDSKAPFAPDRGIAGRIKAAAMARGLICYPNGGTIDGTQGDHVLLAPPFIITDEQIGELVDKLAGAVDAAIGRTAG